MTPLLLLLVFIGDRHNSQTKASPSLANGGATGGIAPGPTSTKTSRGAELPADRTVACPTCIPTVNGVPLS
jgi:hypothetical protein